MYNGISAREDFNNSVRIFENVFAPFMKAGENVVDKFKLTQSAIRLEQPLAANSTLYKQQLGYDPLNMPSVRCEVPRGT